MKAFFSEVLGMIEYLWDFFLNMVKSLLLAINFLITGWDTVLFLTGYLPAIIGSALVIFLVIFLIKFLLGR